MRLKVAHTTRYEFSQPVSHGLQRLRLTPKSTAGQQVLDWRMQYDGAVEEVSYEDHNHNRVTLVSVVPGVSEVVVHCEGLVATADNHGITGHHSGHMPMWSFLAQSPLTRPGPRMRAILSQLDVSKDETLAALHRLSALVLANVAYAPGETGVHTSGEEAAALGLGVCQDHAHIFIGAARALGVPARYVSGYLMMDDRIEQEASHAWAEAHVDGLGWVGFDVSNGISPDERYVRVATGRDYAEAAPVTGMSWGAHETRLAVQLAVEQQHANQ
ncbi:transglutaminase family protein [Novosphingobium arvoryzae]|uniref:Transglutaminase n=1 Tax=Novosphingobium arvoryzae TaxID=1256514 RepID=A0A918VI20_9SPHN|nr:transglutaminase family protein [Novosphingobium arvoryzae]GGZ98358.1 transglutaminase [Novosphingobium arvoryzae]